MHKNRGRPDLAHGPRSANPSTASKTTYLGFGSHEHVLSKQCDSLQYSGAETPPAPSLPVVPEEGHTEIWLLLTTC